MKANRGYIISALATQMILVPILLTVGLFIAMSLFGEGLGGQRQFADILLAFCGAWILGLGVGFLFSKLRKSKPESAQVRYGTLFIPIIYALFFLVLTLYMAKGNYKSGWWGVYMLKNPLLVVFAFIIYFSGLPLVVPVAELMGYTGFVCGIIVQERMAGTALKEKVASKLMASFVVLFIAVVLFLGISTKDILNKGIIEVLYGKSTVGNDLTEYDLLKVAPFKVDNGLAKLDKEASLQFHKYEEMPRLDGATAAYPVYASFVQAVYQGLGDYYEANKDSRDKDIYTAFVASDTYPLNIVKCSKTIEAYERLLAGQTDLIFVAEPSKVHTAAVQAQGDEFLLTPIGSEAFVFFTNKQNPVNQLTMAQLQDIYTGEITNWQEVGGPNKSILAYQRPENSGSQTIMQNKVMKNIKMMEPSKEAYAGGMGEIIHRVAGYQNAKNAIGYSFMYYSSSMIKNNQIKYLAVDGVMPTPETVRNKSYPFTVSVYAVTLKSNTNQNVQIFIDWILSNEGQSLVEKTGYIPMAE